VLVLEGQRHERFGPRRLSLLIGPCVSENEPFGFDHLANDSLLPMIAALRIAHIIAIRVAGPFGALQDFAGETSWPQPLDLALRLSPRLEDEAAGRIEDPRDDKLALGGFRGDATACFHIPTPSFTHTL